MGQQSLLGWVSRTGTASQQSLQEAAESNKRPRSNSRPIVISDDSDSNEGQLPPPPKKRRTTPSEARGLNDDIGEGEVADMSSYPSSRHASTGGQSPRLGHTGWNAGVKPTGLRTSFGSAVTSAAAKPVTVPTGTAAADQKPATVPSNGKTRSQRMAAPAERAHSSTFFKLEGLTWSLPRSPSPGWGPDDGDTWQFKFERWCQDFVAINNDEEHLVRLRDPKQTNQILRDAWARWHSNPKWKKEARAPAVDYNKQKRFPQLITTIERNLAQNLPMLPTTMPSLGPGPGPDVAHVAGLHPVAGADSEKVQETAQSSYGANGNVSNSQTAVGTPDAAAPLSRKQKQKHARQAAQAAALAASGRAELSKNQRHRANKAAKKALAATQQPASPAAIISPSPTVQTPTPPEPPSEGRSTTDPRAGGEVKEATPTSAQAAIEARATARVQELSLEDALSGAASGELSEHAKISEPEDSGTNGEMASALYEAEKEYRERYFPDVSDDNFCTSCATLGHRSRLCPQRACRFCGDEKHMAPGCPQRRRCSKCKQLGHVKDTCQEKLALAPGEDMECAFCASRDHTESDCHEFYRTYHPTLEIVRKVKHIPVFCYSCGNEGHYGTACGLNRASTKTTYIETWSEANRLQYVDPDSDEIAIAFDPTVSAAYANDPNGRPDFGKSIVPRTHIFFEGDDDDEDEDFIRPPIQREQRNRHINVAPKGRGGFSSLQAQYPPLPPGPPPGLPARPPHPSNNKRPKNKKPKPFQQSKQGQGQGQQNGHGSGGFRIRGGANARGRGGRR